MLLPGATFQRSLPGRQPTRSVLGKESFRQASVAVDRIDGLDEPADVAKPGRARERLQALAACRRTCQEKKGQRRQVDGEAAHQ